ncbi:MAG: EamA family transporter [Aeromicrobium sp.]|nr:EamA family transporter [Aeromicrobium sp.]
MAVILSLIAALAWGLSDFVGGVVAKRVSPWQVAVVSQSSAGVIALVAAAVVAGSPTGHDMMFGAFAGVGGGFGAAFLYRGLARARMGVVAPLSAIGTALLPVVVGVVTGDRPSAVAVIGVICAFPAIVLISRVANDDGDPAHRSGVIDGVLAGLGFGLLFVFFGQIGDDAGLGPLALSQLTSVFAVIVTAAILRQAWFPRGRAPWTAAVLGPLSVTAQGSFVYATHHGLLSVVSVISSLYPAVTVLLAAVLLRERIQRWQGLGLFVAAVAVALVATG